MEESSKQLKEEYEALQQKHSELKAAYFELKEAKNDPMEVQKVIRQGHRTIKGYETAFRVA